MTLQIKRGADPTGLKAPRRGLVEALLGEFDRVDRDGKVLLRGAIRDGTRVKISDYGHSVLRGRPPVGMGTIHVTGNQLELRARYFLSVKAGADAFETVRGLAEDGQWELVSQATRTAPLTPEWRAAGARQVIAEADPITAGPVFLSAYPDSMTLQAKAAADRRELVKMATRLVVELEARPIIERNNNLLACLRERHGVLALDVTEKATRWLTDGRVQTPPEVRFEDLYGKRMGYFRFSEPGVIHIARGLSAEETAVTCAHEVSHLVQYLRGARASQSEHIARSDEEAVMRRYRESEGCLL